MGQEYRGYSIRRVTAEPRADMKHEDGSQFRPQVDRWYLIGDTDEGLVFLGNHDGYDDPGQAGSILWFRYHPGEELTT